MWEAPQGPTCIYQARGAKRYVTVAVETMNFTAVRKHARTLSHTRLHGHTAYCMHYGTTTTFVPLSKARVLNVTASCSIGVRFAAKAMARVPG
jgi:hypothetical protein